jgi:hypothetical protein
VIKIQRIKAEPQGGPAYNIEQEDSLVRQQFIAKTHNKK